MKSNVGLQGTDEKLKDHEEIREYADQSHDTTKDREGVTAVQGLPHSKTNLDNIVKIYVSKDSVSFFLSYDDVQKNKANGGMNINFKDHIVCFFIAVPHCYQMETQPVVLEREPEWEPR